MPSLAPVLHPPRVTHPIFLHHYPKAPSSSPKPSSLSKASSSSPKPSLLSKASSSPPKPSSLSKASSSRPKACHHPFSIQSSVPSNHVSFVVLLASSSRPKPCHHPFSIQSSVPSNHVPFVVLLASSSPPKACHHPFSTQSSIPSGHQSDVHSSFCKRLLQLLKLAITQPRSSPKSPQVTYLS